MRPLGFLLMAVGFPLLSFVNGATLVHMLPALSALGLGAMDVVISRLFGSAQVLSRLINMVFGALLLHLFGKEGYGELVGRIAAARVIVSALAPFAFAHLMENWDAKWAFAFTSSLGVAGIASFLWIAQLASASRRQA